LFLETSFDKPQWEEEVVQEVNEIWEECEWAIDELQSEKEKEIIDLTETLITYKLEKISEAK